MRGLQPMGFRAGGAVDQFPSVRSLDASIRYPAPPGRCSATPPGRSRRKSPRRCSPSDRPACLPSASRPKSSSRPSERGLKGRDDLTPQRAADTITRQIDSADRTAAYRAATAVRRGVRGEGHVALRSPRQTLKSGRRNLPFLSREVWTHSYLRSFTKGLSMFGVRRIVAMFCLAIVAPGLAQCARAQSAGPPWSALVDPVGAGEIVLA